MRTYKLTSRYNSDDVDRKVKIRYIYRGRRYCKILFNSSLRNSFEFLIVTYSKEEGKSGEKVGMEVVVDSWSDERRERVGCT